jgi:predicted site-specific integrase-resolvase
VPNIDRPLSEAAAAERIGISIHTLRKWRKAGRGPAHFSVSRVIRYAVTDLQDWITSRTSLPAKSAGGQDE